MDPNLFSRSRLLLSCESSQYPLGLLRLRLRCRKTPATAIGETGRENCSLPAGFPKSIASPTAWTGADFENDQSQERYSLLLNEAYITELEQACHDFEGMLVRG
jgi:hypothetical protein